MDLIPLLEQGLVVRRTHSPEGRGRPAMYYRIAVLKTQLASGNRSTELLIAATGNGRRRDDGEQLADAMGPNVR